MELGRGGGSERDIGTNKNSLFNTTNTPPPHANAMRLPAYNPKCLVASGAVVGGYLLLARPSDRGAGRPYTPRR